MRRDVKDVWDCRVSHKAGIHSPCLECGNIKLGRGSRGLCSRCHRVKSIRWKYRMCVVVREGSGSENKSRGTPPAPCLHRPGSIERILTLVWRAENGYDLWHPNDVTVWSFDPELDSVCGV